MITTRNMAAACVAACLLMAGGAAAAEQVTVQKNGTALRQAPSPNARTEWRVNSGFLLTVLEERDGWMKVASGSLPDDAPDLWVRSNQVAALSGDSPVQSAPLGSAEQPTGYRLELSGTPGMKVRLECRVIDGRHVLVDHHYNKLPLTYEYPGDAISCVLFKKENKRDLQIDLVAIYPTKERLIGRASAKDYPTSIFARSDGPWGEEAVVPARGGALVED